VTAQIASLESQLNSPELVEGKWYRPSHVAYELICYVNNIAALDASKNYGMIPLFIERARKYLSESKAETVARNIGRWCCAIWRIWRRHLKTIQANRMPANKRFETDRSIRCAPYPAAHARR
jgi:hypothetical protein